MEENLSSLWGHVTELLSLGASVDSVEPVRKNARFDLFLLIALAGLSANHALAVKGGRNLLMVALCERFEMSYAKHLLGVGADPSLPDKVRPMLRMNAHESLTMTIVRHLLQLGITPLHVACGAHTYHTRIEAVEMVLAGQPSVNAVTKV